MFDAVCQVLERDEHVAYALVFGSTARGQVHAHSDLDVAVGLMPGATFTTLALGDLTSRLEAAAGRAVDLVLLDNASPALAYRVFSEGRPVVVRDRAAIVARKARAILEYLDFRPFERLCAGGVLRAARGKADMSLVVSAGHG